MLSLTKLQLELVSECISLKNTELTFNCLDSNRKVDKEQIYNTYKMRYGMEKSLRPDNHFVIGYKDLLPNIEESKLEFINVSSIITEKGGFLVFSDYDYSEFVGILKSKRNLSEIKEKQKGFEYWYKSTIFENGIMK
ncbi:hypothetical protein C8N46_11143 [Kordia periserrulae]|uniref:Uncharacterized protein n=1 Tax=Kordia periserrulae TaxID=701523 RepID=A0A2T6BSE4_9FLAO|nr:hypothetical protein [Kordia periserrulae]PTX58974.1 hypothetical protein C8N46_11143 [Kordia periserrulae]